uniref:Uncharacterized protein n=1 Tax=viral metagenome TaxID=1070528 RepID=A0A6C0CSL3_9ZZZZ
MPYVILAKTQEGKKGYKVCKADNPSKCFSKQPLSKETAIKQRAAIAISETQRKKIIDGKSDPKKK